MIRERLQLAANEAAVGDEPHRCYRYVDRDRQQRRNEGHRHRGQIEGEARPIADTSQPDALHLFTCLIVGGGIEVTELLLAHARTWQARFDATPKLLPWPEEEYRTAIDARAELRDHLASASGSVGAWAMSLTGAELRLLPYLATHLTLPEIATKLFLSTNTVKTEAVSIYRKFSASSRSEAIERAVEVGLLESSIYSPRINLMRNV